MTKLVLIAARDVNGVIGFNGGLPWSIPEDLAFFKSTTMGKTVIMGRKTHESIGFALPGRENIVITSKATRHFKGCITATSLDSALAYCEYHEQDEAFVIGGESVYRQAMPLASKLIITEIGSEFKGDTYFPPIDRNVWVETQRVGQRSALDPFHVFSFVTYERLTEVERRAQTTEELQRVREINAERQGVVMSKKYKHPGHILALDKDFTDNLPGMGLFHGLTTLSKPEYEQWLSIAGAETVTRQRDGLEMNPAYRQVLPYTIVAFSDHDLENWADIEVQSYQRTKKVGEERLGGKFSVGFGGHVDKNDVVTDDKSVVQLKETIQRNLEREVGFEELRFVNKDGVEINPTDHPEQFRFAHMGFIRDDSNNVGKVHLGLVNVIFVARSVHVSVKEDELKDGPRLTFDQLKESGLDFENWSRIIIDEMSGSEPTVFPAEVREPTYDMFAGQYFIEAVEGDKLGEIAIEFNTTVRKLLRLNIHLNEGHVASIVKGTRINVPEQDCPMNKLVPVEVPNAWINPTATEEDRQAALTAATLKLVQQTSSGYKDHGLRYLVTESMLERLLDIDPALKSLVDEDILRVVHLAPESPANIVGQFVADEDPVPEEERGFHRSVKYGEANGTRRHVLENGDSMNAICEANGIDYDDFIRWNGFEHGCTWPTHTGYVFVADPTITPEDAAALDRTKQ